MDDVLTFSDYLASVGVSIDSEPVYVLVGKHWHSYLNECDRLGKISQIWSDGEIIDWDRGLFL